jgi:hypothetical protein
MVIDTIEGDLVADAVRCFMREEPWNYDFQGKKKNSTEHWQGTAAQLLDGIETRVDLKTKLLPEWPKNPRALGARLRRIKKGMSKVGIEVTMQDTGERLITLCPLTGGANGANGAKSSYLTFLGVVGGIREGGS